MQKIRALEQNHIILEYVIKPYNREIARYGSEKLMNLSEKIFHYDTLDTFSKIVKHDNLDQDSVFEQAILKTKYYLAFFNLSLEEMISHCETNITNFSKEFPLNKTLRKSLNKNYQSIKRKINQEKYYDFLENSSLKSEINMSLPKNNFIKLNYISSIIHMSMNHLFNNKQRFNEFKTYYFTLNYLKQLKFTQKTP